MKNASRTFIIISIVLSVIGAIGALDLLSTSKTYDAGFLIIISRVISLIVGFTTLKALNQAKKPKDLVTAGVMTLIFCSFLGGLFMLLITEKELNTQKAYITTTSAQISNNNATQFSTATSNIQKTQLVKNVEEKHCPSCGAKLEEDQKFCGVCGKSITYNICSECNTKNKPDDNFCRNCGNKLTK